MKENIDMDLYKECYNDFISEFCLLPLSTKHKEIIKELKTLIAFTNKMCIDYNIPCEMLVNKEMLDIEKEIYSEDDFAESVYAYLSTFKELYGTFLKRYIEDNYVSDEEENI